MNKKKKRWTKIWLGLLVLVLGTEGVALLSSGTGDTLSWHVVDLVGDHPETAGTGIALLLVWLILHWFLWPLWRKRDDNE